jgi:hypothetical protein
MGRSFVAVLSVALVAVLVVGGGGYAFFAAVYPRVSPAPDFTIEATPERLVRGKYLAETVMGCLDCHAERRLDRYAWPLVPGTAGAGGGRWGPENGLPGTIFAPNITPAAIGGWTDGEIYRAITAGLDNDGGAIFPIMPYALYGTADPEDIFAVIAYLRTLPPIEAVHPERELDFPMGLILRTIPIDGSPTKKPQSNQHPEYGRYLATIAACQDCHTAFSEGDFTGPAYAGGRDFRFPGLGLIRSANITPHKATGIGAWTREEFIARFTEKSAANYADMVVAPGEPNTIMPWWAYAGMSQLDLSAIYDFLMSLEPVKNDVTPFEPLAAVVE